MRKEAECLALAAAQNDELIWKSDLWGEERVVPFLLNICRACPDATVELRQAIGTDPLLRHQAGFGNYDFDVDLL